MIVLCELSFLGLGHVPFNAGLLATIRAAFPKDELTFFGAAAHIEELKKQLGQPLAASIAWKEVMPAVAGTPYFKRFFHELSVLRRLMRILAQDSSSRLVLTSAYPATVLALKMARCFWLKAFPVQIVLHGLSGVVGKRYRSPIIRFQDMKTALSLLGNENIQYLVLESSIRDTVMKHFPLLSGRIEALHHPISPNEGTYEELELTHPIHFGFLGLADEAKGFPTFLSLASCITAKYGSRAEFHAIGSSGKQVSFPNGIEVLSTKPTSMQMTRSDFIARVLPLHFIVLPHDAVSYTLTTSGVVLDAIAWVKPVIARKIPIFEGLFKSHGDIGYLFGDDAELKGIIEQIVKAPDKSRYEGQISNLRSLRKTRSPESLAATYREICRNNVRIPRRRSPDLA
jgi:hypothetical protein